VTNDVICTIGSKEGISHMCLALLGPGDTVLVPAPAFPIHVYAAVIAGANVLRIPLGNEDSSWGSWWACAGRSTPDRSC
jgi:alanine-synthesizing transaminase